MFRKKLSFLYKSTDQKHPKKSEETNKKTEDMVLSTFPFFDKSQALTVADEQKTVNTEVDEKEIPRAFYRAMTVLNCAFDPNYNDQIISKQMTESLNRLDSTPLEERVRLLGNLMLEIYQKLASFTKIKDKELPAFHYIVGYKPIEYHPMGQVGPINLPQFELINQKQVESFKIKIDNLKNEDFNFILDTRTFEAFKKMLEKIQNSISMLERSANEIKNDEFNKLFPNTKNLIQLLAKKLDTVIFNELPKLEKNIALPKVADRKYSF